MGGDSGAGGQLPKNHGGEVMTVRAAASASIITKSSLAEFPFTNNSTVPYGLRQHRINFRTLLDQLMGQNMSTTHEDLFRVSAPLLNLQEAIELWNREVIDSLRVILVESVDLHSGAVKPYYKITIERVRDYLDYLHLPPHCENGPADAYDLIIGRYLQSLTQQKGLDFMSFKEEVEDAAYPLRKNKGRMENSRLDWRGVIRCIITKMVLMRDPMPRDFQSLYYLEKI